MFRDLKYFYRQVATLSAGKALGLLIPIAVSPLLTRLYSPGEIGYYGIFMALIAIVSIPGTMRFELAMLLEKETSTLRALVKLTAAISMLYFILLSLVSYSDVFHLNQRFGMQHTGLWPLVLPVAVLALNGMKVFESLRIRAGQLQRVARANVINVLLRAVMQVGGASIWKGPYMLIAAVPAGLFAGILALVNGRGTGGSSWKASLDAGRKYWKYPLLTTPSLLVSLVSGYALLFLLPAHFSAALVGYYALANRIIVLPGELLGSNISTIFMRNSAQDGVVKGGERLLFDRIIRSLLVICVPLFLVFAFVAKPVSAFVFGSDWIATGQIIVYFLPVALTKLLINATTAVIHIRGRQEIGLYHNLVSLVIIVGLFLALRDRGTDVLFPVISLALAFENCLLLLYYRHILRPEPVG